MTDSAYTSLIKEFLAFSAPEQPAMTEDPGPLEMTVDGQTCTVFPGSTAGRLVLQTPVLELSELDQASLGAAFRLLHGLNWVSAVGNGIMALIDDEDRVFACSVHEIATLEAPELSQRMAGLLEAATSLKGLLKSLDNPAASSPPTDFGYDRESTGDMLRV